MGSDQRTAHVAGLAGPALVEHVLDALDALWEVSPHVAPEDRTLFALAVSEVSTNIAAHGESELGITVEVDLAVSADDLVATFVDTADPARIDWDAVTMPGVDSESGRGLALTTAVLDDFEHSGDATGNTWVLRRRLAPSR
ncbi:ATP-binding protein [Microbacterium sp. UFMG61]|uniref:ATP-binding protein n=1 Tax=Microbacterium sp. UFMG61 TaxID=2745935 RepID=UPI00188DD08A|nr:ATP-binding protein [Microbacterium sp. UFMG61]